MRNLILYLLALALTVPGYLSAQAPATEGAPAPIILRAGDAVRITVWRKPELSGEFPISADGSIASPFYMDLRVAGTPLPTVTEQVRSFLALYETEPRVLVEPLLRVSVAGEVHDPSLYTLRPETTVAQAVMQAGGPTERGYTSRVILWRGGQELRVDLTRPELGIAGQPIRSGDQIVMPRRVSVLRDYIAPIGSVIGAAAAVTNIILRRW
jgi:polysaccharide export outer membrane protein